MAARRRLRLIRVVLVSPGDVAAERDIAETIITRINNDSAHKAGIHLDVNRSEAGSYPGLHPEGPQGIVNEQLRIFESGLVIAIFWSRLGTPTARGVTGTQDEL